MSRGYRVVVEPLSTALRNVSASDELCVDIALLPILGEDAMRELLKEELSKDGWKQTADGSREKTLKPGLTATLSKDGTTVTIAMTAERKVGGSGPSQSAAEQAAAANAVAASADVKRQATTTLAQAEGDVRAGLEAAIQRVYLEALQQKARSMGQVESVVRGEAADGSVEITIKVRA